MNPKSLVSTHSVITELFRKPGIFINVGVTDECFRHCEDHLRFFGFDTKISLKKFNFFLVYRVFGESVKLSAIILGLKECTGSLIFVTEGFLVEAFEKKCPTTTLACFFKTTEIDENMQVFDIEIFMRWSLLLLNHCINRNSKFNIFPRQRTNTLISFAYTLFSIRFFRGTTTEKFGDTIFY